MSDNTPERRKEVVVKDSVTEVGIKLNNILTALVLMVMSWVGYNIQALKDTITTVQINVAVQQEELNQLRNAFYRHLDGKSVYIEKRGENHEKR